MNEIKTIAKIAFQGDIMLIRVDKLPEDATVIPQKNEIIVAHSETGHHHVVKERDVVYHSTENPLVAYLEVNGVHADLIHERPFDTHAPLRLPRGIWEVRRQREHTPEGWRMIED